ncbi:MAG: tetratricopeptide repeat protein, partial [Gammaproteobacteria bacterium]|nr:tetratricopeptide repeat protein [Gammaproteobacteria bacterium]
MTQQTFGEFIEEFRKKRGIHKAELARRLHVHRATVSLWLNDTNKPEDQTLLKLVDELGLSPAEKIICFKKAGKEELIRLVELESQPSLPRKETLQDSSRRTIPLQRPPRVPYFTGREKEIEKTLKGLQPGRVVTLCGPGGMGKSAIAAEVVWHLAPGNKAPERFPDGIILYNFYKHGQADLVLEHIARSFGEEPRPTLDAAVQRALAGRMALLLLEGAENADNLNRVLNAISGCGVLITSRQRKDAVDHQYRYDITSLSVEHAVDLLQKWGGKRINDEIAANKICKLVDGVPLAVRLIGSHLAESEENVDEYLLWLEEALLDALDRGEHQDASIPLILNYSLDQLNEKAKQILAVTGLLSIEPFNRAVIVAALELSTREIHQSFWELVNHSILERPENHYQVAHALVHTYARERMVAPYEALPRLASYYTKLTEEQSKQDASGFARLDTERAHIMTILAKCIDQENWEATRSLAWAIDKYLDFQGYWIDRISVIQAGITVARMRQDQQEESIWVDNLGSAYIGRGQYEEAIDHYQQALTIAREIGLRQDEGNFLGHLGNAYYRLGQYEKAIDHYQQALTIAREIGLRQDEGGWLINLSLIYYSLGQYTIAIKGYQQSLTIVREVGDRRKEGIALANLGLTYIDLGQYEKAIDHYQQALNIAREIGLRSAEGNFLGNLGLAHANLGQYKEAIDNYQQALTIAREIGDRQSEGIWLGNLGVVYVDLGQHKEAIDDYERALAIAHEIGDRRGEGNHLSNLGRAYAHLG